MNSASRTSFSPVHPLPPGKSRTHAPQKDPDTILKDLQIDKVTGNVNNSKRYNTWLDVRKKLHEASLDYSHCFTMFYLSLCLHNTCNLYRVLGHKDDQLVLAITTGHNQKVETLRMLISLFETGNGHQFGTLLEGIPIKTGALVFNGRPSFILDSTLTADIAHRLGEQNIDGLPHMIFFKPTPAPIQIQRPVPSDLDSSHSDALNRFITDVQCCKTLKSQTSLTTQIFYNEANKRLRQAASDLVDPSQSIFRLFDQSEFIYDYYKVLHSNDNIIILPRESALQHKRCIETFKQRLKPFEDLGEFVNNATVRRYSSTKPKHVKVMFLLTRTASESFKKALGDTFQQVPILSFYSPGQGEQFTAQPLATFDPPASKATPCLPVKELRKRKAEDSPASTECCQANRVHIAASPPISSGGFSDLQLSEDWTANDLQELSSTPYPDTFI